MMNVNMQDLKYQAVGLPDEVRMYHYAGDFAGELSCIDRWLARQVPDYLRKRLELQKLFAAQLLDDYPLGDDDMVAGLKERFPAADLSTLEALIAKGNVDYILRSGRRCYQQQALSNMLMIHGDFLDVALPRSDVPRTGQEQGGAGRLYIGCRQQAVAPIATKWRSRSGLSPMRNAPAKCSGCGFLSRSPVRLSRKVRYTCSVPRTRFG